MNSTQSSRNYKAGSNLSKSFWFRCFAGAWCMVFLAAFSANAVIYTTNFESGSAGWTVGELAQTGMSIPSRSASWLLTSTTGGVAPAVFNSRVFGTPNIGQAGAENSFIQSPAFVINSTTASITFDSYTSNEGDYSKPYDKEFVEMSLDGGLSWQPMHAREPLLHDITGDQTWRRLSFTQKIPQGASVTFRFRFDTGDMTTGPVDITGWFIDNVEVDSKVIFEADISPTTCNGNTDGALSLTGYGGEAPYTFSIDGGSTFHAASVFMNLAPGVYQVVVMDSEGELSEPERVRVTSPAEVTVAAEPLVSTCQGNVQVSLTVTASGGTPPYQYSIDGGQTFSASAVFSGLTIGQYLIQAKDKNNCMSTVDTVSITMPDPLDVSCTATAASCSNTPDAVVTVAAKGGVPPYQYSIDGGNTWHTSATIAGVSAGAQTVLVKDKSDCVVTLVQNIAANPGFTVQRSPDQHIHTNYQVSRCVTLNAAAFGAGGPFNYRWSNGTSSESIQVCPDKTTKYAVSVTNASGCVVTDTITVYVDNNILNRADQFDLTPPEYPVLPVSLEAYPNPFIYNSNVTFTTGLAKKYRLEAIDMSGRIVGVLAEGEAFYGEVYSCKFDAHTLPEGCFLLRLMLDDEVLFLKMVQRK